MRQGATYNQDGQIIPPGLHIPQNFAWLPYVPHPFQVMGMAPVFPVLGQHAGPGNVTSKLASQTVKSR